VHLQLEELTSKPLDLEESDRKEKEKEAEKEKVEKGEKESSLRVGKEESGKQTFLHLRCKDNSDKRTRHHETIQTRSDISCSSQINQHVLKCDNLTRRRVVASLEDVKLLFVWFDYYVSLFETNSRLLEYITTDGSSSFAKRSNRRTTFAI
jgi:hypothetical protein